MSSYNKNYEGHIAACGDFARLVPFQARTRKVFNAVIQKILADPENYQHHHKYLHYERDFTPEEDPMTGDESLSTPRWVGYYRLNMEIPPSSRGLGWQVGAGKKNLPHCGVDFLLTLLGKNNKVHGQHVKLVHDREHGLLLIKPFEDKVVFLDTNKLRNHPESANKDAVAFKPEHLLNIGDLQYTLQWTDINKESYLNQVKKARNDMGLAPLSLNQLNLVDITPQVTHIELNGYIVQEAVAIGPTSIIHVAIKKDTHTIVAAKKVLRVPRTVQAVNHEIAILEELKRSYPPHPNIPSFLGMHYAAGDASTSGKHRFEDIYIFY